MLERAHQPPQDQLLHLPLKSCQRVMINKHTSKLQLILTNSWPLIYILLDRPQWISFIHSVILFERAHFLIPCFSRALSGMVSVYMIMSFPFVVLNCVGDEILFKALVVSRELSLKPEITHYSWIYRSFNSAVGCFFVCLLVLPKAKYCLLP